jgi:hypothetical protein
LYFSGIDPHHIQRRPNVFVILVKTAIVLLPVLLIASNVQVPSKLLLLTATLSLSLLVVPCLNPPEKFREDEMPSKLKRAVEGIKAKIGGALILKVGSIMLAVLASVIVGKWWFILLCIIASISMLNKSFLANLMIQSDDGEFRDLTEEQRIKIMHSFSHIGGRGFWGCLIATSSIGYYLVSHLGLSPVNWYGFAGILGGVLADALLDSIDA